MDKEVVFKNLQTISFAEAWEFQKKKFDALMKSKTGENLDGKQYLLFCQHPHVYTLGKNGSESNLLISDDIRQQHHIEYFHIDRGGDITYHGPQQLVGYPILDLEAFKMGIKSYISSLEEVIILTLSEYGITASRLKGAIGVWIDTQNPDKARKICAIGVKTSRFVSMHGFAFNINTNLDYFNYINPCGFRDKGVTSMEKELGYPVDFDAVAETVKRNFEHVFNMKLV